ncbi:MAG: hypothetical protein ABI835_15270 [Chloroflexota bacterium]
MEPQEKQFSMEFPSDALAVLQEAAANEEHWAAAMRDPLGFLSERGVKLPEGHSITLSQAAANPPATMVSGEEFEADSISPVNDPPTPLPRPVGGTGTFIGSAGNCPAGSFPMLVLEKSTQCIRQGFYKGSMEWVPGPGGGLYGGHFERPVTPVCIATATVEQWVMVCVTRLAVP